MTISRRLLLALLPAAAFGQASPDEPIWRDFIDWCKRNPIQGSLREQYLAHLGQSLAPDEVKRRDAVLDRLVRERDDLTALWFDRVYSSPTPQFRTEPNAFLVECVRSLEPGKALDAAMGQGRNTIWLARNGWQAAGFDISEEGLAAAHKLAAQAQVQIETTLAGYQQFDFGRSRWDLIVFSYAFVPIAEPAFAERVLASLTPRGAIVYEHFLKQNGRGPKGSTPPGALREAYRGLEIVKYEETVARPDWAQNEAPLVRMFARRRATRSVK